MEGWYCGFSWIFWVSKVANLGFAENTGDPDVWNTWFHHMETAQKNWFTKFFAKNETSTSTFFFLAGLAAILVILVNLIMKWHEFPWTSLWFAITLFGTGHGSRWLPHPGCWQLHKQIQESYGQIQAEHKLETTTMISIVSITWNIPLCDMSYRYDPISNEW